LNLITQYLCNRIIYIAKEKIRKMKIDQKKNFPDWHLENLKGRNISKKVKDT
jgi:hypothetical protein